MNRRMAGIAALAGVSALAVLAWAFAPRPAEVELASVTQGRFETSIEEDGKTRLRDRYLISAPLAGSLGRSLLREGDRVEAGMVVAVLTPVLSPMQDERTLREQRLQVEVAESQVARARVRLERARLALLQANNDVSRSEQLANKGFVSNTKIESDRLAAQAMQKEVETTVEESHVAVHELEQARAALSAVSRDGGGRRFVLRSPTAGRVLRVIQASETVVPLGAPLLEIGDTRKLEVVAELLTGDALRARPGSVVLIDRWGGDAVLQGRVRHVEPAAFTKVSALGVEEQRVRVLIDITSPAEHWQALGDGYRVGVSIVTQSVDIAIKVPASAVFPLPGGSGEMGVFTVHDGRAQQVTVKLGARNATEAWVLSGLQPGQQVIVYPSSSVVDGKRVKARAV